MLKKKKNVLLFFVLAIAGALISLGMVFSTNDTAMAASTSYTVNNPNETATGYDSFAQALKSVKANGTIVLNKNINVGYSVTLSTSNASIDLNGYYLTYEYAGTFLTVTGHQTKIYSSRSGGGIKATNTDSSTVAVLLLGQKTNWRPQLTIGENTTITSNGDSAVINENGVLRIDGATIKSSKFYAIQQYDISYSNQKPITYFEANDNTKVYGIYIGKKGSTQYGYALNIYGGYLYPASGTGRLYDTNGSTRTINITGGYFAQSINNNTAVGQEVQNPGVAAKALIDENQANKYTMVKSHTADSYDWYKMSYYATIAYELNGGQWVDSSASTNYARHYTGFSYSMPAESEIIAPKGMTFEGWFSDVQYTSGPYSYRANDFSSDRTYYAKFTYTVSFLPNDADNNPIVGSVNPSAKFNAGRKDGNATVYNQLPEPTFSRPGYNFLGWSLPNGTKIYSANTYWNFDPSVENGTLTLLAQWEAVSNGTSYTVKYFFEKLVDGEYKYVYDAGKDISVTATAGDSIEYSAPSITGYEYDINYVENSKTIVSGDGASVVELYYKLKEYKVTFDYDGATDAQGNDSKEVTVKYKESVTEVPALTKTGYTFVSWDKSFSNITAEITVKAVWKVNKYNYTFNFNIDQKQSVVEQTYGQSIVFPDASSAKYTFVGWFDGNGNPVQQGDLAGLGEVQLYAKWKLGKPTLPIAIVSRVNDSILFTNYTSYEYQLVPAEGELSETDYVSAATKNIAFNSLTADTEYSLYVRMAASGEYFLASDSVKVLTVKSLPAEGIIAVVRKSDDSIVIYSPENYYNYILKDENGNEFQGEKDADGNIVFTGLTEQTAYTLFVGSEGEDGTLVQTAVDKTVDTDGNEISLVTKADGGTFPDGQNGVTDLQITSSEISFVPASTEYEYRLGNGEWVKADDDGRVKFDNLQDNTTYNIEVRVAETADKGPSESAAISVTTKIAADKVVPAGAELNHKAQVIDGKIYITAKDGFIYYVNGEQAEAVDGLVEYQEGMQVVRAETVISEQSNPAVITEENLFYKAVVEDTALEIDSQADTGSITVTNPVNGYAYYLDGQVGVWDNGTVVFSGLIPNESYEITVKRLAYDNYYESDAVSAGQVTTLKEEFVVDATKIPFEYSATSSEIVFKAEEGYEYLIDGEVVAGNGQEITLSGYAPATAVQISIRVAEQRSQSQWVEKTALTQKISADKVEFEANAQIREVTYNSVTVVAEEGYLYAIGPVGANADNLLYLSGTGDLVFDFYLNENGEMTEIDYAEQYIVYMKKAEDATHEQSTARTAALTDEQSNDDIVKLITNKLPTDLVATVQSDELAVLKAGIVKTNSTLALGEKDGLLYAVRIFGSDEQLVWAQTIDVQNASVGQKFEIYVKRDETDREEQSNSVLLTVAAIEKTPSEQIEPPQDAPIVEIVYDRSIIIQTSANLEYAIVESAAQLENAVWVKGYGGNYRFEGLSPVTTYLIYSRIPENDSEQASEAGAYTECKTDKLFTENAAAPKDAVTVTGVTANSVTITAAPELEYSVDASTWLSGDGALTIENLTKATHYNIYVRYAETDTSYASLTAIGTVATTDKGQSEKPEMEEALSNIERTDTYVAFDTVFGFDYIDANGQTVSGDGGRLVYSVQNAGDAVVVKVYRAETQTDYASQTAEFEVLSKQVYNLSGDDLTVEFNAFYNQAELLSQQGFLYAVIPFGSAVTDTDFVSGTGEKLVFDGLNPAEKYTIYVKRSADEDYVESAAGTAADFTTPRVPSKIVEIPDEFERNTDVTVAADYITLTAQEGMEYAVAITGLTPDVFTEADGGTVKLDISADNYTIWVRRAETQTHEASAMIEVTVKSINSALPQDSEKDVEVTELGIDFVQIETNEGFDYSLDGKKWVKGDGESAVFSGLEPASQYQIYVRRSSTDKVLPSESVIANLTGTIASGNSFTTQKINLKDALLAAGFEVVEIDDTSITIKAADYAEYAISVSGISATEFYAPTDGKVTFENLSPNTEYNIFGRVVETENVYASEVVLLSELNTENSVLTTDKSHSPLLPSTITVSSVTHNSVTIEREDDNLRYQLVQKGKTPLDTAYSDSLTFEGLKANTEYELYAFYPETQTNYASAATTVSLVLTDGSQSASIYTLKLPAVVSDWEKNVQVVEAYEGSDKILSISAKENILYAVSTDGTVPDAAAFSTADSFNIGSADSYKIYIIKAETETNEQSQIFEATMFREADAPQNISITYLSVTDRKAVVKADSDDGHGNNIEYSLDKQSWFVPAENGELEFLNLNPNSKYYVFARIAATQDTAASQPAVTSTFLTQTDKATAEKLRQYVSGDEYGPYSLYEKIILDAETAAQKLTSAQEVDALIDAAKDKIDSILASINDERAVAVENVDDFVKYLYGDKPVSSETAAIVEAFTQDAVSEFDVSKLSEDVERARRDIEAQFIGEVKQQVQDSLESYTSSTDQAVAAIIADAAGKIKSLEDATNADAVIAAAKKQIDAKLLEIKKEDAISQIDESASDFELVGDAQNQIDKLKEAVNAAENKAEVEIALADALNKIPVIAAKEQIRDTLETEFEDKMYDQIQAIINLAVASVTEDGEFDVDAIIAKAREDIQERMSLDEKMLAKQELNDYLDDTVEAGGISDITASIVDSYKDKIENAENSDEISQILEEAKQKIDKQLEAEKARDDFEEIFESLKQSGKYDEKGLDELEAVSDKLAEDFADIDLTPEQRLTLVTNAVADINKVKIPAVKTDSYQETQNYPSSDAGIFASVTGSAGFSNDIRLTVEKGLVTENEAQTISDLLKAGKFDFKDGENSTIADALKFKSVAAKFNITLYSGQAEVTEFEGVYTVRLLLTEDMVNLQDIKAVFVSGDVVEVYQTQRDGNWITFSTTHFSDYYLIGDAKTQSVNLWWAIILLLAVVLGEIGFIIYKKKADEKNFNMNGIAVLSLGAVVPKNAYVGIIILGISAVLLGAYIAYMYLHKTAKSDKSKTGIKQKGDESAASYKPASQNKAVKNASETEIVNKTDGASKAENACKAESETKADSVEKYTENTNSAVFAANDVTAANGTNGYELSDDGDDNDSEDDDSDEIVVKCMEQDTGFALLAYYNKSFTAKVKQGCDELKHYYSELKNFALSYLGTKDRISWKFDRINKGRDKLLKFAVRGKTLYLYLALDANEFADSRFKVENSTAKSYEEVPCLYKIYNPLRFKYAFELIEILMQKHNLGKSDKDGQKVDYAAMFGYESTQALLEQGLIKENLRRQLYEQAVRAKCEREVKTAKRSEVSASEVGAIISSETAGSMIIFKEKSGCGGKKSIINLDDICAAFKANESVTTESLKARGLISKKTGCVKVLARGTLDKPLTVEAADFSIDAVKMILVTGGKVVKLK